MAAHEFEACVMHAGGYLHKRSCTAQMYPHFLTSLVRPLHALNRLAHLGKRGMEGGWRGSAAPVLPVPVIGSPCGVGSAAVHVVCGKDA